MITRFKLRKGIAAYDFNDHYAVLGLPLNASNSQIRTRYLQIARSLHPDVCRHSNTAQAVEFLSKLVNPSYTLLNQERERTEYEAILKLLAKRLMKRKETIRPVCPSAQQLLAQPSPSAYLDAVAEIAQLQYTDLDRVLERTEYLSELNLVFVLTQEGYQANDPIANQASSQATSPPITQVPAPDTAPDLRQLLRQAEQFISEKQWTMALQNLRTVIQAEPTHSQAHALLGFVYMQQKLAGMAKISFQQALKYNPQEPLALQNIAKVSAATPEKEKNKKGGFFGWLGGG
jgi:curved DNA-binding protein CbpA